MFMLYQLGIQKTYQHQNTTIIQTIFKCFFLYRYDVLIIFKYCNDKHIVQVFKASWTYIMSLIYRDYLNSSNIVKTE